MKIFQALTIAGVLAVPSVLMAAPASITPVRMLDGACYCPGSTTYGSAKDFDAYPSINACLADGGRKPRLDEGICRMSGFQSDLAASPSLLERIFWATGRNADRTPFRGWGDGDETCMDAHDELLAAFSTKPVIYSKDGCEVRRGRWVDPYSGEVHVDADDLHVDHLVSLDYAMEHGAKEWPEEKRLRLTNDPENIFVVDAAASQEKSAAGPTEWLPESEDRHCHYVLRFTQIATDYELELSRYEANDLVELLGEVCH